MCQYENFAMKKAILPEIRRMAGRTGFRKQILYNISMKKSDVLCGASSQGVVKAYYSLDFLITV